jgi:hypothetical protein
MNLRVLAVALLVACSRATPSPPATERPPTVATSASPSSAPSASAAPAAAPAPPWEELLKGVMCPEPAVGSDRVAIAGNAGDDGSWTLATLRGHDAKLVQGANDAVEMCDVAIDGEETWVVYGGVTVPSGRHGSLHRFDAKGTHAVFARDDAELRRVVADEHSVYVLRISGGFTLLAFDKRTAKAHSLFTSKEIAFSLAALPGELLVGVCSNAAIAKVDANATLEQIEALAKVACSVRAVPKAGGRARTVIDGLGVPYDLRVDGQTLYVADGGSERVLRVAVAGGAPTILAKDQWTVTSVDLDDEWVYFTVPDAVRALRKDGTGHVIELAGGLDGAHAVRVHGDDLLVRTGVVLGTYDTGAAFPGLTPWGKDPKWLRTSKAPLLAARR